jgi:hypothetical protein
MNDLPRKIQWYIELRQMGRHVVNSRCSGMYTKMHIHKLFILLRQVILSNQPIVALTAIELRV